MTLNVEQNCRWADKLNKSIMKCHDKLEGMLRFNYSALEQSPSLEQFIIQTAENVE